MPGLFSVHFKKDHFTDEMKPVDRFLKGIEDGKVSMGNCTRGKAQVPSKKPMDECVDVSEVCEKSASLSPENRRGCLLFNLCNSPSILCDIHSAAKSVWQGLGQRAHFQ